MENIDWRDHVHSDPNILVGKPVIKGTRLSIEFIMRLFAVGWTEQQILDSYPGLTSKDLRAIFAFAADCLKEEYYYAIPSK
jgi:uncharacterized protein (DUF433 family)